MYPKTELTILHNVSTIVSTLGWVYDCTNFKLWGNSPAVRISAAVMQAVQLTLEQVVDVRAEGGRIIIEAVAPSFTLDELLNGITATNLHNEIDFGLAQGQEQF